MREGLHKVVPADDTIVAISTPYGRSAIGLVRISGGQCESLAGRFFKTRTPLIHRQAAVGEWLDDEENVVDQVLATLFKAPNTYTGEDILELSAHGNPLVLGRIVETMQRVGVRLATAGEFTLRAVLNGKMDLIQAEAVRGFIDAQTDQQARAAFLQMGGSLSRRIFPTKERLLDIVVQLEAGIDFADDDVPPPSGPAIAKQIQQVCSELSELQQSYNYGRVLSAGLRLAIVGKPNVGKSSLFNRFVGKERSIVTNIPGTTRDVVSESASVDGVPLRFFDTAGLRDTDELVEKIGVERTVETLSEADLVIFVVDGSIGIDELDRDILMRIKNTSYITVANKCDLEPAAGSVVPAAFGAVQVSAKTGAGLDDLKKAIRSFLGNKPEGALDSIVTSARQFDCVSSAIGALENGHSAVLQGTPHEMVLLDIYEALSQLNELTGEVVTEDILGRIFSTFCVGK